MTITHRHPAAQVRTQGHLPWRTVRWLCRAKCWWTRRHGASSRTARNKCETQIIMLFIAIMQLFDLKLIFWVWTDLLKSVSWFGNRENKPHVKSTKYLGWMHAAHTCSRLHWKGFVAVHCSRLHWEGFAAVHCSRLHWGGFVAVHCAPHAADQTDHSAKRFVGRDWSGLQLLGGTG